MNLDQPLKGDVATYYNDLYKPTSPLTTMRQRLERLAVDLEQAEDLLLAVDATLVPIADLRAGKVTPTQEYARAIMRAVESVGLLKEAVAAILAAKRVVQT